jgi:tRNA (guanine-N7-)-methyltransferase
VSRVPPLDLGSVLAPGRREGDEEALTSWLARRPLAVEIGFGRPHFLCELAEQRPDLSLLGFETERRWCRAAAARADRQGVRNLRVIEGDARDYTPRYFPAECVDAYFVLFPDPWWKKRHHKRRVFRPDFVGILHQTLAPGGVLWCKTDVGAYGDLIESQIRAHGGFELGRALASPGLFGSDLPHSHREKKCAEFGIPVFEYQFHKPRSPTR